MARRRKYGRLVTIFQRKVRGKQGSWIARWYDPFTGLQNKSRSPRPKASTLKCRPQTGSRRNPRSFTEKRKKARARSRMGNASNLGLKYEAHLLALTAKKGEAAAKARRRSMTAWQSWLGADTALLSMRSRP